MRAPSVSGQTVAGRRPTQHGQAPSRILPGRVSGACRATPNGDAGRVWRGRSRHRRHVAYLGRRLAAGARRPTPQGVNSPRIRLQVEYLRLPEIGGIRLRELTALDVEDLAHRPRPGLSASTIKGALVALAACLHDAQRGHKLTSNPARGVEVPESAARTREVTAPTVEQVRALLEEQVKGTSIAALVDLIVATGARIGEALGARWADVDLEAGTWTRSPVPRRSRHQAVIVGQRTKTSDGRRVTLPASTLTSLRAQRRTVSTMRIKAGPLWRDHDLVFPTSVGTPQYSQSVRQHFHKAAVAHVPGSFHALRHFVATVGLSSLPVAVVSKQLGHRRLRRLWAFTATCLRTTARRSPHWCQRWCQPRRLERERPAAQGLSWGGWGSNPRPDGL